MYKIEDINYMVSLYCPGKCVNCNIWEYGKEIINNEIDINLFENVLQSQVLTDTNYFDLTAGESQLSSKYLEIIKLISKYKPNAFIHTNISGWYPNKHLEITTKCLQYIKKENFRIDISLDGSRQNYEKNRLVKDGYDKVIKTIKLLKPLGINLRVIMIIYKDNYQDIPWLVEFAKEHEIGYFFGYARNANLLQNKNTKFAYSKNELTEIENLLYNIGWLDKKRLPNWLWAKSIYQDNIPFFECYMGKKAIVINPYGDVYPCNECLDFLHMGNIKDFNGDLDKLLHSKKALNVIEKVEKKKCQPCGMLCAHKIEFSWGKQTGMI